MYHVLLFLPVLALLLFFVLPRQAAIPLYGIILLGSLYAYWKALKALRQPRVMGRGAMAGQGAVVVRVEKDKVEVAYQGEIWKALSSQTLQPGQQVIIESVEGLVLRVRPLSQPAGNSTTG